VDGESLVYFLIFWLIWIKEASYSTRFDTSDLSYKIETLLTSFGVLFASLFCTKSLDSEDATRLMMVVAFVSLLHFLLYWRVANIFRFSAFNTQEYLGKQYALSMMKLNSLEFLVWMVGVFILPQSSSYRWVVFVIGILLSIRIPKNFLATDFHTACSKRGVLFIVLLGFTLQSVILCASPFFDHGTPSILQYFFIGCACLLLFCIKMLYVTEAQDINVEDHLLIVSRKAAFFFQCTQFLLLFSTTIMGAGLSLITDSYLSAVASLPVTAKNFVCGGFAAVVTSVLLIKSIRARQVPINPNHQRIFHISYALQTLVHLVVIFFAFWMCIDRHSRLSFLMISEIELLTVLSISSVFLVFISNLDETISQALYGDDTSENEFVIQRFGIWSSFIQTDDDDQNTITNDIIPLLKRNMSRSVYHSLGVSNMNLETFEE